MDIPLHCEILFGTNARHTKSARQSRKPFSTNFLLNVTGPSDSVCTHVTLYALSRCLPFHCGRAILMTEWVCGWKPFWIASGDTFQKACLEEWEHVNDEQSHDLGDDTPHWISRTTESAKLQTAGKDNRSHRGKHLPPWRHGDWGKRSIVGTTGRTTAS